MSLPSVWSIVSVLDDISGTDEQVVITLLVAVSAAIVVRFVLPALVSDTRSIVSATVARGRIREYVDRVARVTPWWVDETFAVRILTVVIAISAGIAILAIWGQYSKVVTFGTLLAESIDVLGRAFLTLVLFVLAWIGASVVDSWLDHVTERSEQFTKHQEEIVYRVVQIVLLTAVSLAVLTMWGVNLGGLIVGAGFLGIVVGIAAQQTLGSLLAGFVLMFSRPFEIGDWVKIGEEEGIVTDITIVNTRMENFDGELVVLPNDTVSNSMLINRSAKGRLRLRVEVGIDYDANPDRAQEVATDALSALDSILSVPRPVAVTSRLGDSAIVLELRFWIDKPSARRRAKATSDAIRAVKAAFDRNEIKIPYPQRELTGREESGGFRVLDSDLPDEK